MGKYIKWQLSRHCVSSSEGQWLFRDGKQVTLKAKLKMIKLFPNDLTALQNKSQEYLNL